MALIRAADRFDPSRGLKFLTYAGKAIRHAILDTIDAEARMSTEYKEGSADAESTEEKKSDDGPVSMNTIHLRTHCLLPSTYETNPEIIYLRKETLEELHDSIGTLPTRQRIWVTARYGFNGENEPCSLAEMCRRYYITPISAKKTDIEAIETISKKMGIKRPAKAPINRIKRTIDRTKMPVQQQETIWQYAQQQGKSQSSQYEYSMVMNQYPYYCFL